MRGISTPYPSGVRWKNERQSEKPPDATTTNQSGNTLLRVPAIEHGE